jgi:general secretion pathway protein N
MVERQMNARWFTRIAVVAFVTTGGLSLAAVDPSGFNPVDQLNEPPGSIPTSPESGAPAATEKEAPANANPLWAIPVGSLTATLQRPLFSPSRREPVLAPAVVAPVAPVKAVVAPPEPEKPQLSLVGVVAGTSDGLAVFLNLTTHDIVRLRIGEGHQGWVLQSVKGREAVLEKNHRTAVIEMPASEETSK